MMLLKSKFLNDTFILTLGVGIAQIIPLLAYPLLSRLYSPQDFGVLASLTSITSIVSIFATLKYENALLITRNKISGARLLITILIIAFLILLMVELLFITCSDYILELFDTPEIKGWLWICPITAYCIVIYNCFNEWCVKNEYFKTLAYNKVINGSSIPIGKLVFAFSSVKSVGLILGDLLGHIITAFFCILKILSKNRMYFNIPTARHSFILLHKYKDCPKYVLPAQLFNKIGYELPVFFTLAYFSAEEVGYYSMAVTLLALPTIVIGRSVGDTFRKKANDIFSKEKNCISFFKKTIIVMSLMSIIGFSLLYYIAPNLFVLVLGNEWYIAGVYCRILCPMLGLSFISQIAFSIYYITDNMKILFEWQLCYVLFTLLSLCIGIFLFKEMKATLYCLVVARGVVHLINIYLTGYLSKGKFKQSII